ncbi:hypothetical protein KAR10_08710 [bacterium]|nr:hypothetical protein [bacterium]
MKNQKRWQLLLLLGMGIFIGTFWFAFGFLSVLGTPVWWYYPAALAPGSAVLFLVLKSPNSPVPYGTALILLGFIPFFLHASENFRIMGMAIGIPISVIGLLFIIWRSKIK